MSQFATTEPAPSFSHASWCAGTTVIDDQTGTAMCSVDETGTCGMEVGPTTVLMMDRHGNTIVALESIPDYAHPNEALRIGLEIIQAATLAGASIETL